MIRVSLAPVAHVWLRELGGIHFCRWCSREKVVYRGATNTIGVRTYGTHPVAGHPDPVRYRSRQRGCRTRRVDRKATP